MAVARICYHRGDYYLQVHAEVQDSDGGEINRIERTFFINE